MREVEGKTVEIKDNKHKVRRDVLLEDQALIKQTQVRIHRRIVPEILKVHQFQVTRMERYLVACYAAEDARPFPRPPRQHHQGHRAPPLRRLDQPQRRIRGRRDQLPRIRPEAASSCRPATACVFSCSLLHQVSAVTAGKRYAFLPFLYDDAAAKLREANNEFLGEGVGAYKA